MPTSRHKPPVHVLKKFYGDRGMARQEQAANSAVETRQESHRTRQRARQAAVRAAMVAGACKGAVRA